MAGKGKFLYVIGENADRIFVKDSAFKFNPDNDYAFPLSKFSTDDLLKVKAQIATELENRMDLDEVTEANLEKLKETIRGAGSDVIASLLRQTIDRLDVVSADEKRANTRRMLLEDELRQRMIKDGLSETKFAGLIQATYKAETVYSVGEEGWDSVYSGITTNVLEAELNEDAQSDIAKQLDVSEEVEIIVAGVKDRLSGAFNAARGQLRRSKDIYGEDISEKLSLLDDIEADLDGTSVEDLIDTALKEDLVAQVTDAIIDKVRGGITHIDAFGILQKRLTSTTLTELVKQGEELPRGITSQEIHKLKVKRTK